MYYYFQEAEAEIAKCEQSPFQQIFINGAAVCLDISF